MLIRLIIWGALAGAGFAGGSLAFRDRAEAGAAQAGRQGLQSWSANQPTAVVVGDLSGKDAGEKIESIKRATRGKLGGSILAHLQLVRDTPLGDLRELYRESSLRLPDEYSEGIGGLVREAIVDRMLAEDPDGLLQWVVESEVDDGWVMASLLELEGYEALREQLADTQFPVGAAKAKATMLAAMREEEPETFWKCAQEIDTLDFRQFDQYAGEAAIDIMVMAGSPEKVSSWIVTGSFETMYRSDAEGALTKLAALPRQSDRAAALAGIGRSWDMDDIAGAQAFASSLGSDRLRVNFLRAIFQRKEPAESFELLQQLKEGPVRETLFEEKLRSWKRGNFKEAREWAEANDQLEAYERLNIRRRGTNAIDALLFSTPGSAPPAAPYPDR